VLAPYRVFDLGDDPRTMAVEREEPLGTKEKF
jgi:hypothetical protein